MQIEAVSCVYARQKSALLSFVPEKNAVADRWSLANQNRQRAVERHIVGSKKGIVLSET